MSLLLDEEYEAGILRRKWIIQRSPAVPGAASVQEEGERGVKSGGGGRCREEGFAHNVQASGVTDYM